MTGAEPTDHQYTSKFPAQWVKCDVRKFKLEVRAVRCCWMSLRRAQLLGEFPIIMADPPWDIHMEVCEPPPCAARSSA